MRVLGNYNKEIEIDYFEDCKGNTVTTGDSENLPKKVKKSKK